MRRPAATDVAIAVALAAGGIVEQALGGATPALTAISTAGLLTLAWRRVHPVAASLTAIVLIGIPEFLEGGATDYFATFGGVIFALVALTAYPEDDRNRPAVAAGLVLVTILAVKSGLFDAEGESTASAVSGGVLFALVLLGLPSVALGVAVRRHAELRERLEAQSAELEAARERRARAAAEAERARVAGELHETTSAAVRAMLAELDAARDAVRRDPATAAPSILRVEERGRDALAHMRRQLGVLRRGDEDLALAPQPSLARLDALARRAQAAGLDVAVHVEGEPRALTPGLDVAAYRVVEDALAHAGAARHADVTVRWEPSDVALEVGVDGPGLGDPSSLTTLRRRVELFSGRLDAGRRPRGGSAIRAELPVEVT
jgi:signal transduction histidine kinase